MELTLSERLLSVWELILIELQDLSFFSAIFGIAFIVILATMLYMIWTVNERHLELQNTVLLAHAENRSRQSLLSIYRAYYRGLVTIQNHDLRRWLTSQAAEVSLKNLRMAYLDICAAFAQAELVLGDTEDDNRLKRQLIENRDRYAEIVQSVEDYLNNGALADALQKAWRAVETDFNLSESNVFQLSQNPAALECFYRAYENETLEKVDRLMIDYQTKIINEDFEHFFENCLTSKLCQET